MDKTAIKNFAIEARKILMKSAITEAGFYGITKDECKEPVQKGKDFEVYETVAGTENRIFGNDIKRRANLVQAINTLGFDQVIEETAYTWFNRIIAIRFMEVNNYLPTRVRVLSSETGSNIPDIITQSDTVELNLSADELNKIQTAKRENRYDDAFRLLFIKQCNELNAILPGLFEKTDDYMELLLRLTYTSDGVVRMLIDSIPEDDFNIETEGQVEIIGWMYQYYNTELKDDTFAKLKKNVKITKERIPAATQLFTPDWIVRYMVENSLGRVWIEHLRAVNPSVDEKAKADEFGWKYYLPEAEQEEDVQAQLVEIRKSYKDLTPQEISCIDPCMGSGHILVYMFDVLMDIYRSEGFSEREAVFDILEKNIRGLDIDRRAYQLSYFALMMKARGYNRIFFRGHEDIDGNRVQAVPRVYAIEESNSIERNQLQYYGAGLDEMQKNNAINQMNGLLDTLHDAKEYGSILNVENYDWKLLHSFVDAFDNSGQMSLVGFVAGRSQILFKKLVDIGETLSRKYSAVVTNPPYMNLSSGNNRINEFVKKNYPVSKADLFAVFIERCGIMAKECGFFALITQQTWMFLSSYEKLRSSVRKNDLINMAHLGARAFEEIAGEVVQTTSFVMRKSKINSFLGTYSRLVDANSQDLKEKLFLKRETIYRANVEDYSNIPGQPIAYWVDHHVFDAFKKYKSLSQICDVKNGMSTTDNNRFTRLWFECDFESIGLNYKNAIEAENSGKKWFPYNKGGEYRKWYGNIAVVVNWQNNGAEIKKAAEGATGGRIVSQDYYFMQSASWSKVSSNSFALRLYPCGFLFDVAGPGIFADKNRQLYVLALLNSKLNECFLKELYPTMNYEMGQISAFPVNMSESIEEEIDKLAEDNVKLVKEDWDSFELSWDFKKHPLVRKTDSIEQAFNEWENECNDRFQTLYKNERRINELFIDLYGLTEKMDPNPEEKEISIRRADRIRDIKSFVSYAVGCMFGRYSLDEDGIVFTGGEFDSAKYELFKADKDNIIPVCDEEYFADDIVGLFVEFVRCIYGSENLEKNLNFIAQTLGGKKSARDVIRDYFINEFYADHCTSYSYGIYGKRPIYWMFDSGKQNGFKCLIYLHRYTPDTVGLIRSDYLTKAQSMIENALKNAEYAINTSGSAVDRAQATKKRDKYVKQLAEIRAYYPALSHVALQKIELNLDDGVKVNYEKFQGVEVSIEGEKKQKVDLLAKI